MYFTIAGQTEDGVFTGTCEPAKGTTFSLHADSLDAVRESIRDAIKEYEETMLDKETTLVDLKL
jgi:predicted RNase H-like HicB family nuclease